MQFALRNFDVYLPKRATTPISHHLFVAVKNRRDVEAICGLDFYPSVGWLVDCRDSKALAVLLSVLSGVSKAPEGVQK